MRRFVYAVLAAFAFTLIVTAQPAWSDDYVNDYEDLQETRGTENGNYTTRWRYNLNGNADLCGVFFGNFSGATRKYRVQHYDWWNGNVLHQSSLHTLANGESGSWVDSDGYYVGGLKAQVRVRVYNGAGTYIGTSIVDPYNAQPNKTRVSYPWRSQNWPGCS